MSAVNIGETNDDDTDDTAGIEGLSRRANNEDPRVTCVTLEALYKEFIDHLTAKQMNMAETYRAFFDLLLRNYDNPELKALIDSKVLIFKISTDTIILHIGKENNIRNNLNQTHKLIEILREQLKYEANKKMAAENDVTWVASYINDTVMKSKVVTDRPTQHYKKIIERTGRGPSKKHTTALHEGHIGVSSTGQGQASTVSPFGVNRSTAVQVQGQEQGRVGVTATGQEQERVAVTATTQGHGQRKNASSPRRARNTAQLEAPHEGQSGVSATGQVMGPSPRKVQNASPYRGQGKPVQPHYHIQKTNGPPG